MPTLPARRRTAARFIAVLLAAALPAAAVLPLALPRAAMAQEAGLDALKAQGLVGERFDGYVGAVKSQTDAATQQVIDRINLQRKDRYRAIAARRGASLSAVERIAGAQVIERAPSGTWVMPEGSGWVQKP
ncbi:YdbL family protein [Tistrella mobilis]|uniref:YdbL family protein n=1 Tax=Tistrella mobilis TaxID=171437 RepID=UPI003558ABCE